MIWRDDDIQRRTKLPDLTAADDLFQVHGVPHTLAVIADGIEHNTPLVDLIRTRRMIVQVHAWTHEDLTLDRAALAAIPRAADHLETLFGQRPTVLYPPWNRSSPAVVAVAASCGLRVSTEKWSLEQYLKVDGDVPDLVLNFHYWNAEDVALLRAALPLYVRRRRPLMKTTDYCPRAAPFDVYLRGRHALVGVEVGVDAGAHAEALLRHLDIAQLYLVDRWPREYHYGFCEGRLSALGFRPRFTLLQCSAAHAVERFRPADLDFVYCDETRDAETALGNVARWWPLLKPGGLLGYRGYGSGDALSQALDGFVAAHPEVTVSVEPGELILEKP